MEIKIIIDDRLVRGVKRIFSRRVLPFLLAVILSGVTVGLLAEPFVIPYVFKSGEVISSSQMNANFADLQTRINEIQAQLDGLVDLSGDSLWALNAGDYYYNGGDVGIGTAAPSSLLHLYNTGDVGIKVESANVSYPPYVTLGMSGDYGVKLWRHTSNDSLNFDTGGSTRMTLDTAGTLSVARIEDTAGSSYYVDPAASTSAVLNGIIDAPLMMSKVYTVVLNSGTGSYPTTVSTADWEAFVCGVSDTTNVSVARRRYWVYDYGSNGDWDVLVNYENSANVNVRVRVLFIRKEMFKSTAGNIGPA